MPLTEETIKVQNVALCNTFYNEIRVSITSVCTLYLFSICYIAIFFLLCWVMKTNIVRLLKLLRWSNCLARDLFLSTRLSKHVPDEIRKNRRNADCLSIHYFICLDSRFCLNGQVHISCNCSDFPRPVFKSWTIHIVLTVGSMG